MKIQSHALLIAVASLLGAAAHAQSNGSANTSLNAIRSVVNPSLVIEDSFNPTTTNTVDASRRTVTTVDASRRTVIDASQRTDAQRVTTPVSSVKDIAVADTQGASNVARMSGAEQNAHQGDFVFKFEGGSTAAYGGYGKSPAEAAQTANASNTMLVDGDNHGAMSNLNYQNLGGGLQIVGSRLGNDQVLSAGAQTQGQVVDQDKRSATQTNASDVISNRVSK